MTAVIPAFAGMTEGASCMTAVIPAKAGIQRFGSGYAGSGFRDGIRVEQAAFREPRDQVREPFVDGGHVDHAVDDHVAGVDAARSERTRHGLRDRTRGSFPNRRLR